MKNINKPLATSPSNIAKTHFDSKNAAVAWMDKNNVP